VLREKCGGCGVCPVADVIEPAAPVDAASGWKHRSPAKYRSHAFCSIVRCSAVPAVLCCAVLCCTDCTRGVWTVDSADGTDDGVMLCSPQNTKQSNERVHSVRPSLPPSLHPSLHPSNLALWGRRG